MPAVRSPSPATFVDLEALGDSVRAEIIGGAIVEKASPSMEHGRTQKSLGGHLGRRFDRRPGGRWPGGWWIGTEVDVEYQAHELYRHGVVGWRRERVRVSERETRTDPAGLGMRDLVAVEREARLGRQDARAPRVRGASLLDLNPEEKILVVHRHQQDGFLVVLTASSGETVRAEPFAQVDLRVGVLFGDEDEDD